MGPQKHKCLKKNIKLCNHKSLVFIKKGDSMKQTTSLLLVLLTALSSLRASSIVLTPNNFSSVLAMWTQPVNIAGLLDLTFGGKGFVETSPGGNSNGITGIVLQPDGKIVAAGDVTIGGRQQFALARYNVDGSLDATFNPTGATPGVVTTILVTGRDSSANGIALQSDGKIIAAGRTIYGGVGATEFGLVRYLSNGALDPSFGTDGVVTLAIGTLNDTGTAVALQSDGKIVMAGYSAPGIGLNHVFAVARFDSSGNLDPSFGGGVGYVTTRVITAPNDDHAYALTIQSDGKIVVGGQAPTGGVQSCTILRYNTDGTLDTTEFGNGLGYVITPISSNGVAADSSVIRGLTMQSDGKILAVGWATFGGADRLVVLRYTSAGVLDTTFGGGVGYVITQVGTTTEGYGIILQPDGKIVVSGTCVVAGPQEFIVARYTTDGTLDSSFGNPNLGYVLTSAGAGCIGYAIAQKTNGELVIGGKGDTTNFLVAQYMNPFTVASFTASYGGVGLL